MRQKMKQESYRIAFCALMAALGTALMALGGLIPIATYCSPMLASVLLIPVLYEWGKREAWMVWAVCAALSLLLCPDKESAFLYLFLGFYPILRPRLDAVRPKALSFLLKLLFFALMLGIMYALLIWLFQLEALLEDVRAVSWIMNLLFFVMLVAVMMIYDLAFGWLCLVYQYRIRPRLRFLNRD